MNTIQDVREQVKKNGGTYQVKPDGKAPEGLQAGDRVVTANGTYLITGTKEGGGYTSQLDDRNQTTGNYQGTYDRVGTEVRSPSAQETGENRERETGNGDGLAGMIREAQLQTQQLMKPQGIPGEETGDGGRLKLKQAAMLQGTAGIPQPQAGEQEDTGWTDSSYTTFRPTTGETRTGRYVDPRAGELVEKGGTAWMVGRDGELTDVQQKTQAEIAQMQQQARDDRYQVTGRIYGLNPDGSTPQWLSVGDQVVTGGGTYIITGHKPDGGYYSELYDPKQTTGSFSGQYNTGTYGSIIGERNGFQDSFKGNRESNGAYTGYGGYSQNRKNGKMQFDTMAFTFDGEQVRTAIQDGQAFALALDGSLEPLEAGSLVQDASQRYWVVGADGRMIDVTPENWKDNPLNSGMTQKIQRDEAEKAGLNLNRRAQEEARRAANQPVDAATQAQIDQLNLQLEREKQAAAAANQELYRQYRKGQLQLGDQLVGAGLSTTGASEKAQAGLTAEYLAAMNQNQQGVRTSEEDTAYQIQLARLQSQQEAQDKALAQQQQKAATLAAYGDFSGYGALGYTPGEIQGMTDAYARENAQDNTYGGLSSYAKTLLEVYRANKGYDIRGGLQQALDSGLITQQDYLAALQAAAGMNS